MLPSWENLQLLYNCLLNKVKSLLPNLRESLQKEIAHKNIFNTEIGYLYALLLRYQRRQNRAKDLLHFITEYF